MDSGEEVKSDHASDKKCTKVDAKKVPNNCKDASAPEVADGEATKKSEAKEEPCDT